MINLNRIGVVLVLVIGTCMTSPLFAGTYSLYSNADSPDGWIVHTENNTRQWVSTECRVRLEAAGIDVVASSWAELGIKTGVFGASLVPCDDLVSITEEENQATPDNYFSVYTETSNANAWIVFTADDTKQWVSETCRSRLIQAGASVVASGWKELGPKEIASEFKLCDDLIALIPVKQNLESTLSLFSRGGVAYGFVIDADTNTWQWVSADCRTKLEDKGIIKVNLDWKNFSVFERTNTWRNCDELLAELPGLDPIDTTPTINTLTVAENSVEGSVPSAQPAAAPSQPAESSLLPITTNNTPAVSAHDASLGNANDCETSATLTASSAPGPIPGATPGGADAFKPCGNSLNTPAVEQPTAPVVTAIPTISIPTVSTEQVAGINPGPDFTMDVPKGGALAGDKPRIFITTDPFTFERPDEFDDLQSLIETMLLADVLDIEGIASTRTEPVFRVIDAYEKDLPHIRVGDKVAFTVASIPNKTFSSRITFIDPLLNPTSRVAAVRTEVSNSNDLWWVLMDNGYSGIHIDPIGVRASLPVEENFSKFDFPAAHAKDHGHLGNLFYYGINWEQVTIAENRPHFRSGDLPSLLYLLRGNPDDPTAEHWGGRFEKVTWVHGPGYEGGADTFWTDVMSSEVSIWPNSVLNPWRESIPYDSQRTLIKYHMQFMPEIAARYDRARLPNGANLAPLDPLKYTNSAGTSGPTP